MPNNTGPHSANNAKTSGLPANLKKEMIIGYTREAKDPTRPVTVYTSLGHFTQVHPSSWNIGWDSYENWKCLFFGNIPNGSDPDNPRNPEESSASLAPVQYVDKLTKNFPGHNRFDGLTWDLTTPAEGDGYHLREFWIRGAGLHSKDRFAHPSRGCFYPVTDQKIKAKLWREICARPGTYP